MKTNAKNTLDRLEKYIESDVFDKNAADIANLIIKTNENRKLVAICGNGGSAADSAHWTGELVCTYERKDRKPIGAISLCDNTSIITAWSNDFEYETVFERQIEALKHHIGLVIGLSTSGKSKNVVNALSKAKMLNMKTVLITGNKAKDQNKYDITVEVPSSATSIVQTGTQILYHSICELIDRQCVSH